MYVFLICTLSAIQRAGFLRKTISFQRMWQQANFTIGDLTKGGEEHIYFPRQTVSLYQDT